MSEDRITGQRAGWQDIATAPRDGTEVLLYAGVRAFDGWWDQSEKGWVDGETYGWDASVLVVYEPTHWMPLPPPPNTADDITAGLEALSEPIVAEWGEVKDRFNLGKED